MELGLALRALLEFLFMLLEEAEAVEELADEPL
jgi:hypothetical protein